MKRILVLAGLTLACTGPALAQYKYIGPDGRLTYSDQPPPAGSRPVPEKSATPGASAADPGDATTAGVPFAVQQAAAKYPVTLYTAKGCPGCDTARNLLRTRGVPHTEKLVESNDDIAAYTRLVPSGEMPLLVVGSTRRVGLAEGDWNSLLTTAGYPESSQLPKNYSWPQATHLVPPRLSTSQPSPTNSTVPAAPPPPPTGKAPPGFKF